MNTAITDHLYTQPGFYGLLLALVAIIIQLVVIGQLIRKVSKAHLSDDLYAHFSKAWKQGMIFGDFFTEVDLDLVAREHDIQVLTQHDKMEIVAIMRELFSPTIGVSHFSIGVAIQVWVSRRKSRS